jgi:hypothetical protein
MASSRFTNSAAYAILNIGEEHDTDYIQIYEY